MNWIEVNGTSLRYELSGSGKTTLVLVHEMGGTLDSWDQVMPAVSGTRRVLRYDTRGAGMSEKLQGPVTWDDMAGDVKALLDALKIEGKVALAGIAVGAGIAVRFAATHADRAGALVLPASPSFYGRPQTIDELLDTVVGRVLDHLELPRRLGPRWGESP